MTQNSQENRTQKLITPFIFEISYLNDNNEIEKIKQFDDEGNEHSVLEAKDKKVTEVKLISLLTNSYNFVMKVRQDESFIKLWRRKISVGSEIIEDNREVIGITKEINGQKVSFVIKIPSNFYTPVEIYTINDGENA